MEVNGIRIAIAGEDQAHRALASFLADRVVLTEALARGTDWITADTLKWHRTFCGRAADDSQPEHLRFYHLQDAERDVANLGRRPLLGSKPIRDSGFINGRRLEPEARLWRRILLLFAAEQPRPDALIVVRDTDGYTERLKGLRQALELMSDFEQPWPVIVAAPHPDAEVWFVAGFTPRTAQEAERLTGLKKELSFAPPYEPHRLTAHPNRAPTDAKRVLRVLIFGENESRPPRLEELPELCERTLRNLDVLQNRGVACGLTEFLNELRVKLVPLLIPGPSPS